MHYGNVLSECKLREKKKLGRGDGKRKYVMGSEIRIYFLVVSKKCRRE